MKLQELNGDMSPTELQRGINGCQTVEQSRFFRLHLEMFTDRSKRGGQNPEGYSRETISALWVILQDKEMELKDAEGHYDIAKSQFQFKLQETEQRILALLESEETTVDDVKRELSKFRDKVFKLKVPKYMWEQYGTVRDECLNCFQITAYAG